MDKTGDVDVGRFIDAKHYDARNFYPWVNLKKGRTPSGTNLARLCHDLECSVAWLLHGEESRPPVSIRPGVPAGNPLPVEATSTLKGKHTKRSVSARGDATLRKVPRKMTARGLRYHVRTAARETRRLAS